MATVLAAVGNYVVLRKVEPVQEGLIVRVREDQRNEGEVVSIGGDVFGCFTISDGQDAMKVGDVVLYNGGRATDVDGEKYVIVKDEEILAIKRTT